MKNVMLDLETLGTRPGSVIVSIGAVFFDEAGLGPKTTIAIDIADAQREGLTIDAETVRWWLAQSPAAKEAFGFDGLSLRTALKQFTEWLQTHNQGKAPRIWGNGASFDLALLAEAYARCGMDRPWRYSHERCYRTLAAGTCITKPEPEIAHNALSDAIAQAEHAVQILREISKDSTDTLRHGRAAVGKSPFPQPTEPANELHRLKAQMDTIAYALGADPTRPEGHHVAVQRVLHLAARANLQAARAQ